MPFGPTASRNSVPLEVFSGIVTAAEDHDLPEGASPRNQDVDFLIGNVHTRPGLASAFNFSGGNVEDTAGLGVSGSPVFNPWSNPSGVTGTTSFASVSLTTGSQSIVWTPSSATNDPNGFAPWSNPNNVFATGASFATSVVSTFTNGLAITGSNPNLPSNSVIQGIVVSFAASGTNCNLSCSLGSAAQVISTTGTLTAYTLGASNYLWGFSSISPAQLSTLIATIQGESLTGSNLISVNDFRITVYFTGDAISDQLISTEFGFDISSGSPIVSLNASLAGFATAANTLTGQLTNAGMLIGSSQNVSLPLGSSSTIAFNPAAWLINLTPTIVNSTTFGLVVTAECDGTVSVQDVQLTVNIATEAVNFDYLKTGNYQLGGSTGDIQTLALDSQGSLWVDPDFSGSLALLKQNLAKNAFAKSVSQNDREYICISNLKTGADLPYQYVPYSDTAQSYLDRISQVGPGAPPLFTTSQTGSNSAIANITAWSITSNIVTFTAVNTFTAGEVVAIAGLTTGSFLNGASLQVLATGLSGTAFEASFTHANASATEAGTATPQYAFAISTITQPAAQTAGFPRILWSAGPGSTSAGNVVTFYYEDTSGNPTGDTTLISAVNSGTYPTYVFISGAPVGNGTQQVTSVGIGKAPSGSDNLYYFTIQANEVNYQNFSNFHNGSYQQTVGTIATQNPVPDLVVSNQVLLTNVSPSTWDGTYTITAVINGSTMVITATSCTSGTATFDYALTGTSTAAPVAGEYVNITGTLGGDGALNGPGQLIASVTGTTTGTFTITGYVIPDFTTTPEQSAQAVTYGTEFTIDPGPAAVNTANDPILGNATGGQLTIVGGSTTVVGAGTRQGVVFFETRNGFQTAPSSPVTFTTPTNTNYIFASNLPIGPPNTLRRWVAFTEAGQNNIAGGSFYTIPTQVQYTVNGITFTTSSLVINDNITSNAKFTFTDQVLLAATEIDVQGNNLFNQIELANPAWVESYAGRLFFGLCNSKIQNFNNLTFDGGYLSNPGGNLLPLGWSVQPDATATASTTLNVSPVFGMSYFISNTTGSSQTVTGMIYQSAYQDAYNQNILQPNTLYSLRVTCRTNTIIGSLVIDLTDEVQSTGTGSQAATFGTTYASYQLPCNEMTSSFATYTGSIVFGGNLANIGFGGVTPVPTTLQLRVWAESLSTGSDIEIDRIEIYPTQTPIEKTAIYASYIDNPEAIDGVTGKMGLNLNNNQAVNGATVMYDLLYFLKEKSIFVTQDTAGAEPSQWDIKEVSKTAGAIGPNAFDGDGENYIVTACRSGVYVFTGRQPQKINWEIQKIWEAINWTAGHSLWVRNDTTNRRLYIGIPLPTPNYWLPFAPTNSSPSIPNIVLMCNYQAIGTGDQLSEAATISETMFGNTKANDMRRKWTLWSIQSPYAAQLTQSDGFSQVINFGNGITSSQILALDPEATNDAGAAINSRYMTYGFANGKDNPLLGLHQKRYHYIQALATGSGTCAVTAYPNTTTPQAPNLTYRVPGGLNLDANPGGNQDFEKPLNVRAQRMFLEFATDALNENFELSKLIVVGSKDVLPVRGNLM